MDRRQFLATAGLVGTTLTAGCLGTEEEIETGRVELGTSGTDAEPLRNREVIEIDGGTMRVTATNVQRSVVSPLSDNRIYEPANGQFLMVQVSERETIRDRISGFLRLELDGREPELPPDVPHRLYLNEEWNELAFGVPVRDVELARIRYPEDGGPVWRVPDSLVEQFASAAQFSLEEAAIVTEGGETVLRLRVDNDGDRDGVFRGVTRASEGTESQPIRFSVDAGESVTASISNDVVAEWPSEAAFSHRIDPDIREFSIDRSE